MGPDPELVILYAHASVRGIPYADAVASGAWFVTESPTRGQDAESVRRALESVGQGDAFLEAQVGRIEAALIHQDPTNESQVRPNALYWSDGMRDMSIVAVAKSNVVIDLGRWLACR